MRILRPRNFVTFALAALSGTILMHTSQSVQKAEEKYRRLQESVAHEEERLHLLRAEWASLNRPERLEKLAAEFLEILPPAPEVIVRDASALPEPAPEIVPELLQDDAPQTVLQPVSYEPPSVPDVPPAKPANAAPSEPEKIAPLREKTFDEMMRELGGGQ